MIIKTKLNIQTKDMSTYDKYINTMAEVYNKHGMFKSNRVNVVSRSVNITSEPTFANSLLLHDFESVLDLIGSNPNYTKGDIFNIMLNGSSYQASGKVNLDAGVKRIAFTCRGSWFPISSRGSVLRIMQITENDLDTHLVFTDFLSEIIRSVERDKLAHHKQKGDDHYLLTYGLLYHGATMEIEVSGYKQAGIDLFNKIMKPMDNIWRP